MNFASQPIPGFGPTLIASDDPTGNNQPAWEVVTVNPGDGSIVHSGFFFFLHANQTIQGYWSNAASDAASSFSVTDAGQTATAPVGNSRLVLGVA